MILYDEIYLKVLIHNSLRENSAGCYFFIYRNRYAAITLTVARQVVARKSAHIFSPTARAWR